MFEILGDRQVSVSRELTKMFEETLRGKLSEVLETLSQRGKLKGEFTAVIEGYHNEIKNLDHLVKEQLNIYKEKGLTLRDAVKEVSRNLRLSKSKAYKVALKVFKT